jgi:hypothetical protein
MREKAVVTAKDGKMTPYGRERIMELRMGEDGAGELLGSVAYFPWSSRSSEIAGRIINEIRRNAGVEIVEWRLGAASVPMPPPEPDGKPDPF